MRRLISLGAAEVGVQPTRLLGGLERLPDVEGHGTAEVTPVLKDRPSWEMGEQLKRSDRPANS